MKTGVKIFLGISIAATLVGGGIWAKRTFFSTDDENADKGDGKKDDTPKDEKPVSGQTDPLAGKPNMSNINKPRPSGMAGGRLRPLKEGDRVWTTVNVDLKNSPAANSSTFKSVYKNSDVGQYQGDADNGYAKLNYFIPETGATVTVFAPKSALLNIRPENLAFSADGSGFERYNNAINQMPDGNDCCLGQIVNGKCLGQLGPCSKAAKRPKTFHNAINQMPDGNDCCLGQIVNGKCLGQLGPCSVMYRSGVKRRV